jgi:hypothetical protein
MADIKGWTDRAAELLKKAPWEGPITFYHVSEKVVRGTGITNQGEVKKFTKQVRDALARRSATARRARAANKNAAAHSSTEAARRYP